MAFASSSSTSAAFRPGLRTGGGASGGAAGSSAAAAVRSVQSLLRVRAPVPRPQEASTWEDELWRLRRLYGANQGLFEEAQEKGGLRRLQLTLHCTDPDWEAVNWAPEGLRLEIEVPASYPDRVSDPAPELRLLGAGSEGAGAGGAGGGAWPRRFAELVPRLFAESLAQAPARSPAIYHALRHVDRHLAALFLKLRAAERGAGGAASSTAPGAGAAGETRRCVELEPKCRDGAAPWNAEEQGRLDAAIAEFRSEADAKRRWASIASRVGGGRTPKECADRFRACRSGAATTAPASAAALCAAPSDSAPPPPPPPPVPAPAPAPAAAAEAVASAINADEVRRLGSEVRMLGLQLEGFQSLLVNTLRLEVVCARCRKPNELEAEEGGTGTKPRLMEGSCGVCRQRLEVRVAPAICHGGCAAIAHVLGEGCHPVQFLRSDFSATCGECTETVRVRNVGPGYRKRSNCAACHAKLNLVLEGAELVGTTVAHWREVAAAEGQRLTARRRVQDARRREREEFGLRVGQPLPHQGACKHFMKSYRWLRFPCCGRAFPCDSCHDEQSDHPYEWANRMLCGFCSFEQLCSKDRCGNCGRGTARERTAYWEGGEGCRNRTLMSKSDGHKYKGLGKCISNKAVSKCSK